ncbi:hypothetical protein D9M73_43000 [compost metagenome]
MQRLDGANHPFEQIHVVAGLVHEGAAIHLPGAAPLGLVVVALLGPLPEDVERHHVDLAETLFFDRLLEQLERGVAAVLLDHKEVHAGVFTGAHHANAVFPFGGHGLFGQHVPAAARDFNGLPRMKPAGCGHDHAVRCRRLQHGGQRGMPRRPGGLDGRRERLRVYVADVDQLRAVAVLLDGVEMVFRDAATSHQSKAYFPAADDTVHRCPLF